MNLKALVASLSDEEKKELLEIMSSTNDDAIVREDEPRNTHPPFIDDSRWQHEEPVSQSVDPDFTMNKKTQLNKQKRREKVRASDNTWTDTGEHRDVETPKTDRTPRNRVPPKKKTVKCHVCGKNSTINATLVYGEYYRCDRCTG